MHYPEKQKPGLVVVISICPYKYSDSAKPEPNLRRKMNPKLLGWLKNM
jgi:hypothetical protein